MVRPTFRPTRHGKPPTVTMNGSGDLDGERPALSDIGGFLLVLDHAAHGDLEVARWVL